MHESEIKLRAIFATSALLAFVAVLEILRAGPDQHAAMLAALTAGLCLSGLEASGLCRLTRQVPWRLFAAFLLGLASLCTLERFL